MPHTCHAKLCDVEVPPKMLMCKPHWRMVPKDLQNAVWDAYRIGQEVRKDPSREWQAAADAARIGITEELMRGLKDERVFPLALAPGLPSARSTNAR